MDERRNTPDFEQSPLKWRYNFTKVFFTFWKTVKMYGGENERIDEEIATLRAVLDFFFQTQESLKITFDGIDVKIDSKHRIRGRRADDVYFEDLYDLFISLCLSEVEFQKGVTNDELLSLFRTIGKFPLGREPKVATYNRFLEMIPEKLPHIVINPYDPEEAGNLPLFSSSQRLSNIYKILAEEFIDQQQLLKTNDSLPLKVVERSVQDLLTILLNNMHSDVWDFAIMLTTTRSINGSSKAAEGVNRIFLAAALSLSLSLDKIEAKYLLLSAFYQSLTPDPQKGFFATARMSSFYIGRTTMAVNSALQIKDFHAETALSSDAQQDSITGAILKVVAYYLAITNPLTPAHLIDGEYRTRTVALQEMNKLAMKRGFAPEVIAALRKSVGTTPCGSLVTYENGTKIAIVIGRPQNASSSMAGMAVDHLMNPQSSVLLSIDALQSIAKEQLIEVPAATITAILNSFLPEDENDEKDETTVYEFS